MVMTALGAGVYTGDARAACSIIGSTGVHMRADPSHDVLLNAEGTGYVIALPVPGIVTQMQTNMAATLNIDWVLRLAADLMTRLGHEVAHGDLVGAHRGWLAASRARHVALPSLHFRGRRTRSVRQRQCPRRLHRPLQHPPLSPTCVRAVVEGLGLATRDCYAAMGDMPASCG